MYKFEDTILIFGIQTIKGKTRRIESLTIIKTNLDWHIGLDFTMHWYFYNDVIFTNGDYFNETFPYE
jgi:hypothetical protein